MKITLFILVFTFSSCVGQGQKKHTTVENDHTLGVTANTVITSTDSSKTDTLQFELTKTDSIGMINKTISYEQKYLIKEGGVDIFSIGQIIPTQANGYSITQSTETRMEEGIEFAVPIYMISEEERSILKIEPFDEYYTGQGSEKIGNIYILSDKFRTAENIGLKSTIEEFMAASPDLKIWYSYVSDIYVIETPRLDKIQFLLDGNDFIKEGGPDFDNDMTILQPSEFKKGSKIKAIRIFGYAEDYF